MKVMCIVRRPLQTRAQWVEHSRWTVEFSQGRNYLWISFECVFEQWGNLYNVIHYTSFLAERHHNQCLSIVPIPSGYHDFLRSAKPWSLSARLSSMCRRETGDVPWQLGLVRLEDFMVILWESYGNLMVILWESYGNIMGILMTTLLWWRWSPSPPGWLKNSFQSSPRASAVGPECWFDPCWSFMIFHHHLHHKFSRLGCACVAVDGLARTSREWSPNTTKVLGAWCLSPCCGMKKDRHGWTCQTTCFSEVSDLFSEVAMDVSVSEVETTLILEKRCKEEEASAALDVAPFLEASCAKLILSASG